MSAATGGSALWFRNRFRQALATSAELRPTGIEHGGRRLPATLITLLPYAGEPRARRFQDRRYAFTLCDALPGWFHTIRTELPAGPFDNVLWDASLQIFSPADIKVIMTEVRKRLKKEGVLSGYLTVDELEGKEYYDHDLRSKVKLSRFLLPYFSNVLVLETEYPVRRNFYFFASDGTLPFASEWQHAVRAARPGRVADPES